MPLAAAALQCRGMSRALPAIVLPLAPSLDVDALVVLANEEGNNVGTRANSMS
jgi:hypothetical protein